MLAEAGLTQQGQGTLVLPLGACTQADPRHPSEVRDSQLSLSCRPWCIGVFPAEHCQWVMGWGFCPYCWQKVIPTVCVCWEPSVVATTAYTSSTLPPEGTHEQAMPGSRWRQWARQALLLTGGRPGP